MESTAIVTIGLCIKNAETIIKKAMDSLCNQSFPAKNTELIVVDGNSKDNTVKMVKANLKKDFQSFKILSESNGLGFARQMVVEQASGKYIVWLDADLILSKDYVKNQVAFMDTHPEVGIAGPKFHIDIGHGLVADLENIVYAVDSLYGQPGSASKFGYLPGAEGAIYRVKAVREAGGFDLKIKGAAEDTEMAYRVKAKGWELSITNEMITESTRATWLSLWHEYFWYGRGGHFIFHKNPDSLNLMQMSPPAGFLAGILRSPEAYLLTHKKSFFLLPVHYTYKRLAWFFGFCDAHLRGYGHKLS